MKLNSYTVLVTDVRNSVSRKIKVVSESKDSAREECERNFLAPNESIVCIYPENMVPNGGRTE